MTSSLFQHTPQCWYFAQKITDELEAAGKAVFPIGLTDTAIGGQRIEEYMVNDTSFYDCNADASHGGTTPGARDWNGTSVRMRSTKPTHRSSSTGILAHFVYLRRH